MYRISKASTFAMTALGAFVWQTALVAQQEVDAMPPREQNMWQTLIMIGIVVAFFYFILWRPEQKRRKALEQQRASLKKGDRVTAMGIIGTIVRIEENTVVLKMYDGSKIEMLKAAVTDVLGSEESSEKAE